MQFEAHINAQSRIAILVVTLLGGCATLDRVDHPKLSKVLASEIENDLNLVNKDDQIRLKFRGFLTIGPHSFEKYQYGDSGARLILNTSSKQNVDVHSVCYLHPESAMEGSAAGRPLLAFELFRHRLSDPTRKELENSGVHMSEFTGDDAMCFRLFLGKSKDLLDTLPSHLATFSDLDYERGKEAFESAVQQLGEPPSSIYEILTSQVDQIRYRNIENGTRYGVPRLTSKVSLLERKAAKELQVVRASYYPSQMLSIIITRLPRRIILEQFRTRMKRTHLEAQPLTATSSSAFARLEEQIGAGSSGQGRVASVKWLPGLKDIESKFLLLSWVLPVRYHQDYVPLRVAAELLAHRWTLSSRLEIHTQPRRFGGRFDVLTELPQALTSTHATAHVRQLIGDISSHSEIDQEINRIKNALQVEFWTRQSNPMGRVKEIEKFELIHGDFEHLRDEEDALRKVDRNQVVRVLSEYLLLQTPILVGIGDQKK